MTGRVYIFLSCNCFLDARTSPRCFHVIRFRKNNQTSFWNFVTWCLFMLSRFPLRRFIIQFQRNLINSFVQDWRKWLFSFVWKWLEHLENKEILCVHRPWIWNVSVGPGLKILRDWIWCLCNNVIDRLFEATSQSTIDRRVATLRVDTNQLALIGDRLCTKRTDLHHVTRFEGNKVRVLELNVSPKFVLMKQVVLNVKRAQPTMSSNSCNINKRSWFVIFFTGNVKGRQVVCTVFFSEFFTPWTNSGFLIYFCKTS